MCAWSHSFWLANLPFQTGHSKIDSNLQADWPTSNEAFDANLKIILQCFFPVGVRPTDPHATRCCGVDNRLVGVWLNCDLQ